MAFFQSLLAHFPHVIALTCSCLGSFCLALGLISMKLANIKMESAHNTVHRKVYLQGEWIFGLAMIVVGNLFNGGQCHTFLTTFLKPSLINKNSSDFHPN